jgi:hypothetical protein
MVIAVTDTRKREHKRDGEWDFEDQRYAAGIWPGNQRSQLVSPD